MQMQTKCHLRRAERLLGGPLPLLLLQLLSMYCLRRTEHLGGPLPLPPLSLLYPLPLALLAVGCSCRH